MRKAVFVFMLLAVVIAGCGEENPSPQPQSAPPSEKQPAPAGEASAHGKPTGADLKAMALKMKEMSASKVPTSVTLVVDDKERVIDDAELSLLLGAAEDDEADNEFALEAFGMETFDEVFFTGTIPKDAGVAEAKNLINMQLKVQYAGDPAWPSLALEGAKEDDDKYYAAAAVKLEIESVEDEVAKGKFSGSFAEIVDDEVTDKMIHVRGTFTALLIL